MAMLAALCAVAQKEDVFCLHVEHGLRPAEESSGDAEFVRDFCEKRGINCRIVSIPPGKIASFARRKGTGLEAAAGGQALKLPPVFSAAGRFSVMPRGWEKTPAF